MLFNYTLYGLLANILQCRRESRDVGLPWGGHRVGPPHGHSLLNKVNLRPQRLRKQKIKEIKICNQEVQNLLALMHKAPYATYIKIIDQMGTIGCGNTQRSWLAMAHCFILSPQWEFQGSPGRILLHFVTQTVPGGLEGRDGTAFKHVLISVGVTSINVPESLVISQGVGWLETLFFTLEKGRLSIQPGVLLGGEHGPHEGAFCPGLEWKPMFLPWELH